MKEHEVEYAKTNAKKFKENFDKIKWGDSSKPPIITEKEDNRDELINKLTDDIKTLEDKIDEVKGATSAYLYLTWRDAEDIKDTLEEVRTYLGAR